MTRYTVKNLEDGKTECVTAKTEQEALKRSHAVGWVKCEIIAQEPARFEFDQYCTIVPGNTALSGGVVNYGIKQPKRR
jgi:hypothetical protein